MLPESPANFGMDAEIGAMVPEGDPVTRMSGATFASVTETLRKHLENTFYADRKQTVYMLTKRIFQKHSVSKVIPKAEAELESYEANCIYAYGT